MTFATTASFASETEAQHVAAHLTGAALLIVDRHEEIIMEFPPLPYTTATLLEDTALAFNWTADQIMQVAQGQFEAGLITYPRTDSERVTEEAVEAGRKVIMAIFGKEALGNLVGENFPPQVQGNELPELEAHEAIRPTSPERHPDELREIDTDACRLYRLIWGRFLASLMKPARYRVITVTLESEP
jgi:DNA topoisomerase I